MREEYKKVAVVVSRSYLIKINTMKMYITVIFVMAFAVQSSYQLTCINKKTGKSVCETAVCKKDLKCEGRDSIWSII